MSRLPAVLACAVLVGACGGSAKHPAGAPISRGGGTATVLVGSAPDSLDPSVGYTTEAGEAAWASHLPLLTYRHAGGVAGTQLIPALAKALPSVSPDGRTYTLTLRHGLHYTDGTPVRTGDFAHAIERAIRLNWGGKAFFTANIAGAAAYDAGKADAISGIEADQATGTITIHLEHAYGAFANVLAFTAAAPLPGDTPMKALPQSPPPGVGPYSIQDVVPDHGYALVRSAAFAALRIPGVPAGTLDAIRFTVVSDNAAEAEQVLDNKADVFDAGDTIPPGLLDQIRTRAGNRFAQVTQPETLFFFLNTQRAPFDRLQARQAVEDAIDRDALARILAGFMKPDCYFLPDGIAGHPAAPCPYGLEPDPAKARALVRASGTEGERVTVWSRQGSPFAELGRYYASVLSSIGYKTSLKLISDSVYFQTIGSERTNPQTGLAEWVADFPNPSDFYLLLDARSIQPQGNVNFSRVRDPLIQSALARLDARPAAQLSADASQWQALDRHAAQQAYMVVAGHRSFPKFFSDRLDFRSAVFSPVFLHDVTSWRLASGAR